MQPTEMPKRKLINIDNATTALGATAGLLRSVESFLPEKYKIYSQFGIGISLAIWGFLTNRGTK